jgi:uncharacterized protein with FMN-binding domain
MRNVSRYSRNPSALRMAAIALSLCVALSSCATPAIEIGSPDLAKVADGPWIGSYDGGLVKVRLRVDVKSHRIESVTILKHDCGKGRPAERIVDSIVARQGLDVDTVSGATYSSKCILKAAELALAKAAGAAD